MIFGRKKQTNPSEPDQGQLVDELVGVETESDSLQDAEDDLDQDFFDDDEEVDDEADEWIEYDKSADWREEGPFDIDEVDLDSDDIPRLDLGSLIVTPEEGMQIQIIADSGSGVGLALVLSQDNSALQLEVKAAPLSGGYAAEIRNLIIEETLSAGGNAERVKGPYGTELRRVVPVETSEHADTFAPMRDWLVEGPRWILVARLIGEAAVDVSGDGASRHFEDVFRNLIVRRGEDPMAPGQTVPLKLPEG